MIREIRQDFQAMFLKPKTMRIFSEKGEASK
jgi:hypothetical protein